MSYDRQIDQVCQHGIVNEAIYLSDDYQTLAPAASIAAGNQVKVVLNGEIEVPSTGVQTPPTMTGTRAGPFRIQTGVNDLFRVRLNQTALREVTLPANSSMTTDNLVRILNEARIGAMFSNMNGRLSCESIHKGASASLFVPTTSTVAATLGIAANVDYRGKDLLPPWALVNDESTVEGLPYRFIIFDRPLRGGKDFFQLSYTTFQQQCRRCAGTGVENDWRYTRTGGTVEVRDEALLIQECLKLIYTEEGSNPFHTWYGTRLIDQIGQKIGASGIIQNLIVSDIYRAFGRWQSIKRQQEVAVGQEVSDEEYPYRLLGVDVSQSNTDPTVFFVNITVQNRSGRNIVIDRGIRIPEPQDLLGSTQQQGILRQSLRNYVLTG